MRVWARAREAAYVSVYTCVRVWARMRVRVNSLVRESVRACTFQDVGTSRRNPRSAA